MRHPSFATGELNGGTKELKGTKGLYKYGMKKVGIIKRLTCLCLIFLLSINSFAAIVSDNDGSAFITKAEFDALKASFQSQIDSYNQSIDSKIDGAIASYLAGIKLASTQVIEPSFSVPGYIAMKGDSTAVLERTKSDYININCVSFTIFLGTEMRYYGVQSNNIQTTHGVDTSYTCRLATSQNYSSATTKKHAAWLGYAQGSMTISGTLTQNDTGAFEDNGKIWALESTSFGGGYQYLQQAWGWAVCRGTEKTSFGGFWVGDCSWCSEKDAAALVGAAPRPFGSATSVLRGFPNTFSTWSTRTHDYEIISKPYVTQYDTSSPKIEMHDGYEWFCNDGGDKDWSSTYMPFTITNRYRGNSLGGSTSQWFLCTGGAPTKTYAGSKVTNYPTDWEGHFYGCPYKGYNENITTMDDLYDTDYSSFISNLNSSNNCKSSEQYTVGGQQVWCQSMGFPLTKVPRDGTLEIYFERQAGNTDYVVRICKGAQNKDYAYNTDIAYAVKNDLNGTAYNTKFGGFIISDHGKIRFDVAKDEILTVKFIPLNTAKTDFDGYVEVKPIENMILTFSD